MIVVWTLRAERDRRDVLSHIAERNPAAAEGLDVRFAAAAERLSTFPFSGRPGQIPDTLELIPHPNYRLLYRVTSDTVRILAVVHASRQWPPTSEEPG